MAKQINQMTCSLLPVENEKYLISNSIDIINGKVLNDKYTSALIKQKTNLPSTVYLQVGTRIMFLNNSQYKHKICNGTIGVITDIDIESQEVSNLFTKAREYYFQKMTKPKENNYDSTVYIKIENPEGIEYEENHLIIVNDHNSYQRSVNY
ncbi:hypothetical protein C1645_801748 [Glomus cerebriforme]|uniref:DNA helicase n=1 Tax=Glomus cerebriforme TaxID=658196 RepID=A0A397THR9_9GLOM|nr:hypothetical protein C1645_801748 [Glomus cerebriforme]